jgi:hypothetical protein
MKATMFLLIIGLSLSSISTKAQSELIDLTKSDSTELLTVEQISNIFFQGETSLLKVDTLPETLAYSFKVKEDTLIVLASGSQLDRPSSLSMNYIYALIYLINRGSIIIEDSDEDNFEGWADNLISTTSVNPKTVIFTRKAEHSLRTKDGEPLLIYGLYNPKALKG